MDGSAAGGNVLTLGVSIFTPIFYGLTHTNERTAVANVLNECFKRMTEFKNFSSGCVLAQTTCQCIVLCETLLLPALIE